MPEFLSLSPDSIYHFIQKAWWFLIVLGILVAFHEFGHYLAARWVGVKVLKFSLGFGPKLLGRTIGETEYLVSAVPLGGYVKLFGEDASETVSPTEQLRSFSHQSLLKKTVIVAAGPGFNFLLSYIIFTIWLAAGSPLFVPKFQDLTPTVEAIKPGSPAHQSGFQVGDRILRVDEESISTKNELYDAVNRSHGRALTIDVLRDGHIKSLLVSPKARKGSESHDDPMYLLGIEEFAPLVAGVVPDSPALKAGFEVGDRIIKIDGQDIHAWSQMTEIVRENPGRRLEVQVQRQDQVTSLIVIPTSEQFTDNGKIQIIGKIGIMRPTRSIMKANSPLEAPLEGLKATWSWCELTVVGVYKMITGEISTKNIGGPIMIASITGDHAEQGLPNLVFLIAILSINLGILNLLPIPILDGGHLFFFAWEAVLGRPLGERPREIAQQVGLVLLISIMVYATWNDLARLLQ